MAELSFDTIVLSESGVDLRISVDDYVGMALDKRVRLLTSDCLRFYRRGREVDAIRALAELRTLVVRDGGRHGLSR